MLEFSIPYYVFWHLVIAALFIFSIITGSIGLYSKEKSFVYYSGYSFVLMCYIFLKSPYQLSFVEFIYNSRWSSLNWYLQSIYYSLYFFFFLYFLSINEYFKRLHLRYKQFIQLLIAVSTLLFIVSVGFNSIGVFEAYYFYAYIPITFLMALYVLYHAGKTPGKLKYFFITGSSVYLLSAFIAFFLSIALAQADNPSDLLLSLTKHGGLFYFYIGILIEHMIFALGLAYRVKEINYKVISSYKENENLKIQLYQELEDKLYEREMEVKTLTKKAEREKLLKIKSEFEGEINKLHLTSFHSQMNPHFIFNALNSIKVFLIENEKEKAVYYLNKFAKLIRKILEASRNQLITLEEELSIIELYMSIEKIRQTEEINFKIDIEDQVKTNQIKVPSLILQPFIENSIWHGLAKKQGEKNIFVKVYLNNNHQPELCIEDNGIGRKTAKELKSGRLLKKKSLGLQITRERLEFFNEKENKNYRFSIQDLENKRGKPIGTKVFFYFEKKTSSYFSAG
ncbi:MAG: histidine kinase [Flavobacteriaceae bacterium]|nr:histidine kinase [Flavobacteriaceae bacterium]